MELTAAAAPDTRKRFRRENNMTTHDVFLEHPKLAGRVDIRSDSECWNWLGATKDGYGSLHTQGRRFMMHRFVYELFNGPVTEEKPVVRHSCDNRLCVNPLHLLAGTIIDNVSDRVQRKRCAKGEGSGRAKLTLEIVEKIRSEYKPYKVKLKTLAEKYGVCTRQIWMIANGKSWKA